MQVYILIFFFVIKILVIKSTCIHYSEIIVNATNCRTAWPNAQNCIKVEFSARLKSLPKNENGTSTDTPALDSMDDSEMSRKELIKMWIRFGRQEFANNGFKVL